MRPFAAILLLSLVRPASARDDPAMAVEAVALGRTAIRVYWNQVAVAIRYVILRNGARIGEAGPREKEFTDSTAQVGKTYSYSVAAMDSAGHETTGRAYIERAFDELPRETRCDVLVVGATTAGVSAAVTAARYGLKVVLIEETRRLGGMPVNGLGATDIRRPEHSSGFFEEFRQRVRSVYGSGDGFSYEPRIAHQAIKEIVWSAPGLIVHRQVRPVGIKMRGSSVAEVDAEELPSGRRVRFLPRLVVDATECGDMAAWAGAPFRVGREPRSKREPHAGNVFYDRAGDKPLPGSTGKGDKRVQAYAYLMTVQDFGPGADKTIPRPEGYDPAKYSRAPKWETTWAVSSGKLPNGKFEVNQHPHGSDLQGVNYQYPTASYAERRRIEKLYKDHALGYLYCVQTVEGHKNIGLSEDDYRDSDNWPQLLYIREARRFESDSVLDEYDITHSRAVARPDVIGLGDYPMDSHAVQPKTDWSTPDMGEGEFYLPQYSPWHQAPYGVMIPKRVENVFVPTAVSATHVAYGTLRLEPVRMHFGEAAGIACWLCIRYDESPRSVPVRQIQTELVRSRLLRPDSDPAYLYFFPDVKPEMRKFRSIQWLAARGFFPSPEPLQRTVASGQTAQLFRPDDWITKLEAAGMLDLLKKRCFQDAESGIWGGELVGYNGITDHDESYLTREEAAKLICRVMGWRAQPGVSHYVDLRAHGAEEIAAETLFANSIDSDLWESLPSRAPDGRRFFRPNQPMTRAQFAELVYLAHIHVGPLWYDHVADLAPIPIR